MMQKKTGPRTSSGKAIASKNAIKHGGFAKNFVNEEEKNFYHSLVEALKKDYPNSSTLMVMQIDRIARIQVQLHRIQNTIDAAFVIAKNNTNQYTKLFKLLECNDNEQVMILEDMLGIGIRDDVIEEKIVAVTTEIHSQLSDSMPANHDDVLKYFPKFCSYIQENAEISDMSVNEYLNYKIDSDKEPRTIIVTWQKNENQPKPEKSLEDEIRETPYELLKKAICWYSGELARLASTRQKVEEFKKLFPTSVEATTPDLDELDKMMRYQTTLQRQLSTAIGELLKLNETNISRNLAS